MWQKIKFLLSAFFPSYKNFIEMGFRAEIQNQNFSLVKRTPDFSLEVYQHIEPFNPVLSELMDFDLDEGAACIVVKLKDEKVIQGRSFGFEFFYQQGRTLFFFDRFMELDDEKLAPRVKALEEQLKKT